MTEWEIRAFEWRNLRVRVCVNLSAHGSSAFVINWLWTIFGASSSSSAVAAGSERQLYTYTRTEHRLHIAGAEIDRKSANCWWSGASMTFLMSPQVFVAPARAKYISDDVRTFHESAKSKLDFTSTNNYCNNICDRLYTYIFATGNKQTKITEINEVVFRWRFHIYVYIFL